MADANTSAIQHAQDAQTATRITIAGILGWQLQQGISLHVVRDTLWSVVHARLEHPVGIVYTQHYPAVLAIRRKRTERHYEMRRMRSCRASAKEVCVDSGSKMLASPLSYRFFDESTLFVAVSNSFSED